MNPRIRILLPLLLSPLLWATPAFAHQPLLEKDGSRILDPTLVSEAVYGSIGAPGETDTYTFTASKDDTIPFEVLVPERERNAFFRPALKIMPGDIEIPAPAGERSTFYEPFSLEYLYHGVERQVAVKAGVTYTVQVFDPRMQTGDYALGIGTAEDFGQADFGRLIGRVFDAKLRLGGRDAVPWLDIFGLFLFIAGFVVGLGAVTVIDLHGFLGRTSPYWTEATIRTHKVTKPLIWLGISLATIGGLLTYRSSGPSGTGAFHLFLLVVLVLNGYFLSFVVSPLLLKREKQGKARELLPQSLQIKIAISFVCSFLGWWSALFLLVWHVLVTR